MAIHGGDIYGTDIQKTVEEGKEILDFSANINPLGGRSRYDRQS